MKIKTLAVIFFILFSFIGHSQDDKRDKIKVLKTAFFTQELQLTSAEAEKFWPIYNEYDNKIYNLKKTERKEVHKIVKKELESLTDNQAELLVKKIQQLRIEESKLKTDLEEKLTTQLGAKRVLRLKKAEYDFHKQLLDSYRKEKKN